MEYFGLPSSLTLASETAKSLPPPCGQKRQNTFNAWPGTKVTLCFFSRCTVFFTYKCISNTYTYISVGDKDQTVSNTTLTPHAQLVKTNLDIGFYSKIHDTISSFAEDPVTSS